MKRDALPLDATLPRAETISRMSTWRRHAFALLTVVAGIFVAYWPTAIQMAGTWMNSQTYAHAVTVPVIVAWLIWRARRTLLAEVPSASAPWIVPFAGCGVAWLCGQVATANVVSQLALVAMLVCAVACVLGTRVARRIAFPLAFLFFAVPVGDFLLPTLMQWTADFTVQALRLTGVPVYREGQEIVIPSGRWSIVEACSGIRYLIASLMVGTLYAYLHFQSNSRRLAFVGVAILIPIVANWLRAYMIVMLGHLSNNRLAIGVDHLIYGWLFFGFVMFLMFWGGSKWREPDRRSGKSVFPAVAVKRRDAVGVVAALLLVLVVLWPAGLHMLEQRMEKSAGARVEPLSSIGAWRAQDGDVSSWIPVTNTPSSVVRQMFSNGQWKVGVYIAYFRHQSGQRKVVTSSNILADSVPSERMPWAAVSKTPVALDAGAQGFTVIETRLVADEGRESLLAASWYWIDGRSTGNEYLAKLYTFLARMRGRDDGAIVIVYAKEPSARDAVRSFIRDAGPAVLARSLARADEP
jgi:exosortase A